MPCSDSKDSCRNYALGLDRGFENLLSVCTEALARRRGSILSLPTGCTTDSFATHAASRSALFGGVMSPISSRKSLCRHERRRNTALRECTIGAG